MQNQRLLSFADLARRRKFKVVEFPQQYVLSLFDNDQLSIQNEVWKSSKILLFP